MLTGKAALSIYSRERLKWGGWSWSSVVIFSLSNNISPCSSVISPPSFSVFLTSSSSPHPSPWLLPSLLLTHCQFHMSVCLQPCSGTVYSNLLSCRRNCPAKVHRRILVWWKTGCITTTLNQDKSNKRFKMDLPNLYVFFFFLFLPQNSDYNSKPFLPFSEAPQLCLYVFQLWGHAG